MDVAYDHIQEENFPDDEEGQPHEPKAQRSLSGEFQDAYKAFSQSQLGAKLGGLWGTVKKQVLHTVIPYLLRWLLYIYFALFFRGTLFHNFGLRPLENDARSEKLNNFFEAVLMGISCGSALLFVDHALLRRPLEPPWPGCCFSRQYDCPHRYITLIVLQFYSLWGL